MELKTKYNLGDKVWCLEKVHGEVAVYVDTIIEIFYNSEKGICYLTDDAGEELAEENVILETEDDKLLARIKELWNKIVEEE